MTRFAMHGLIFSSLVLFPAAADAGKAGIVVQFPDGAVRTACVEFAEAEMTGYDLLQRASFASTSQQSAEFGAAICSIEGIGCSYPAESCFCRCPGNGQCTYWSYWTLDEAAQWVYASVGASSRRVRDGSVDGWMFGDGRMPPIRTTFRDICR